MFEIVILIWYLKVENISSFDSESQPNHFEIIFWIISRGVRDGRPKIHFLKIERWKVAKSKKRKFWNTYESIAKQFVCMFENPQSYLLAYPLLACVMALSGPLGPWVAWYLYGLAGLGSVAGLSRGLGCLCWHLNGTHLCFHVLGHN